MHRYLLLLVPAFLCGQSGIDGLPDGWSANVTGGVRIDEWVEHEGRPTLRIERAANSPQQFTTATASVPVTFGGNEISLRAYLRTESVTGFAGLWLREDSAPGVSVGFQSMQQQNPLKGTNDWEEYRLVLPRHAEATRVFLGFLIEGTGKVWADDIQLLADGKVVWESPKLTRSILTQDREFDSGSGVVLSGLTPAQIDNLWTLGKVWGFLKYHDHRIVTGQHHWDYELFRILPKVIAAADRDTARATITAWVRGLGPVETCSPCRSLNPDGLHSQPDIGWIRDTARLGSELAGLLTTIYDQRPLDNGSQFYVGKAGASNATFKNEPAYEAIKFPDSGYQLLAIYRLWNIVAYWFPYRDVLPENWDGVLREFIPRVTLAANRDAYQLELMALIAKISDTHANLWSSLSIRPPVGACEVLATFRFVENRPVVTAVYGAQPVLRVGDAILAMDNEPVDGLTAKWKPYYADSNEAARQRDMANSLTRGACGPVQLRVERGGSVTELTAARVSPAGLPQDRSYHNLPGPAFRILSPEIAYLKLSAVKVVDIPYYLRDARNTKGLVIDIRNYPSEFVPFALGGHFVTKPTEFVQFTMPDLDNPGAMRWRAGDPVLPKEPLYTGKVVVLVDEVSQSQAEYTSMAFRAAGATIVGSTTAGADGNVSEIPLPGGLRSMISGLGVFYPDKRPTQQIGILPDIERKPTITGIREGRDEVLEEGVQQILGPGAPIEKILEISRP